MRNITIIGCLAMLTACAAPTGMSATGGSKADGVVEMSYEYSEFQKPIIDPQQGMNTAVKRCKAWGYKQAEPFDGGIQTCIIPGGFGGCARMRTTISYQCTH